MSFDTRDTHDVPDAHDMGQETTNPGKQLSPGGKRAVQAGLPPGPAKPAEPPPEHTPVPTAGTEDALDKQVENKEAEKEIWLHGGNPER